MAIQALGTKLHFPEQGEIVSYLRNHPELFPETERVICAVARFFAGKDKVPSAVDVGVILTMKELNKTLDLPAHTLARLSVNLTRALKDCAAGKQFALEKKKAPALAAPALRFPQEDAIIRYLQLHPRTGVQKDPYLSRSGIINSVADVFAGEMMTPEEIDRGVGIVMTAVKRTLCLPEAVALSIGMNLTQALRDCAQGKKPEVENKVTSKL